MLEQLDKYLQNFLSATGLPSPYIKHKDTDSIQEAIELFKDFETREEEMINCSLCTMLGVWKKLDR